MRRVRMVAGCLVAAFAMSAVAGASASAAVPEIGRCVAVEGVKEGKKTVFSGGYTNSSCTKVSATKKGRFEWFAGAGAKKKFAGEGEAVTLETVGGAKIACTEVLSEGEYTGLKTATVHVSFHQCESVALHRPCQSTPTESSEIATEALEGEIGFVTGGAKPVVGLDLKHSPNIATFNCGKAPEIAALGTSEGSVIAPVTQIDKMTTESLLKYKAVAGKQAVEKFEGGVKDTLTTTLIVGLSKTVEESGLTTKIKNTSEEPLEIKAK